MVKPSRESACKLRYSVCKGKIHVNEPAAGADVFTTGDGSYCRSGDKMKRVVCNEEYCIGCGLCAVHCITGHSRYQDPVRAYKRQGLSGEERSRVRDMEHVSVTQRCQHCRDPLCIQACLTGALHRDADTGTVLHDEERCVACGTCLLVCPLGGLIHQRQKSLIRKCDLCRDREEPLCVANCPNAALKVVEE